MKICKRCGSDIDIESHHIHCRFMDNPKGYGNTIDLCKNKCHIPLHLIISSILWKYIEKQNKYKVIKEIENFTKQYVNNYSKKEESKQLLLNNINEEKGVKYCINCGRELDIEDKFCEGCYMNCDEFNCADCNGEPLWWNDKD